MQSHTRYGDAAISNAIISARIWYGAMAAGNIFKIAAKPLQIETWLLLSAYRNSSYRSIQLYYRWTPTTYHLATIHALQSDDKQTVRLVDRRRFSVAAPSV